MAQSNKQVYYLSSEIPERFYLEFRKVFIYISVEPRSYFEITIRDTLAVLGQGPCTREVCPVSVEPWTTISKNSQ